MRHLLAIALALFAPAAFAESVVVEDAYARVARPGAPTGAIFMILRNTGDTPAKLIGAATMAAKRVELHTHIEKDGIMMMRPIEDGITIDAQGTHTLERGGDHVMLMGLTQSLKDGMIIELTLTFEALDDITTTVPVDNVRGQAGHGN